MLRRSGALAALTVVALLAVATPAWAHVELEPGGARVTLVADQNAQSAATTTTEDRLPGTTLEAEQRDDGTTSPAPWLIGSGIAALVAVAVGGTILKRHAG